jgi:hypothetical protein
VNQIIEKDTLVTEPGVLESFSSCRPLSRVVIQELKEKALTILTDLNNIFFLAREVTSLVVPQDFISRIASEKISACQQIK